MPDKVMATVILYRIYATLGKKSERDWLDSGKGDRERTRFSRTISGMEKTDSN